MRDDEFIKGEPVLVELRTHAKSNKATGPEAMNSTWKEGVFASYSTAGRAWISIQTKVGPARKSVPLNKIRRINKGESE